MVSTKHNTSKGELELDSKNDYNMKIAFDDRRGKKLDKMKNDNLLTESKLHRDYSQKLLDAEEHYTNHIKAQDEQINELQTRLVNATKKHRSDLEKLHQPKINTFDYILPQYLTQTQNYNPYSYIGYTQDNKLHYVTLDEIKHKITELCVNDVIPPFTMPVFQWATKIKKIIDNNRIG